MFRRPAAALTVAAAATTLALAGCSAPRPGTAAASTSALADCTRCHGDAAQGNAAPPRSVAGLTDPAQLGVGAHQAHLAGGALAEPVACGECHVVPATVNEPGHQGKEHAAVAFGPLATSLGAAASWDRTSATCTTYCHGATLTGGANTAPRWTQVDGTQAACGTCHGVPPPAPHVQLTTCGNCHAGYTQTSVNLATHLDGQVEVNGAACTSCHGGSANAAPPTGTHGETATTTLAVGAHQRHLTGGALRGPLGCGDCHVVPASTTGHPTGTVNVTFGALATTGNAAPTFAPATATCSGVYCHGATLNAGGTLQTPVWTRVDGTQAACGTCHALPPSTAQGHPSVAGGLTVCAGCHPDTMNADGTINVAGGKHIDGKLQMTGASCTSCHGQAGQTASPSSPLAAAPPTDSTGAATGLRVGAHQKHLLGGTYSSGMACQTCHANVATYTTSHANGVADVGFTGATPAALRAGTYTPRSGTTAASCSGTACHAVTSSSGTSSGGTLPKPAWNGAITACTSCHGLAPNTGHHLSVGEHVSAGCGACHSGYSASAVNKALHVNGVRDVGGSGTKIATWAKPSCTPQSGVGCHSDAKTW
ncbi:CxxxxCH/CxxCH domain c-type cytochrome [Anaeromyxobacter diazotrophicus]|uniref:Cytochrome C family protein n=1 Tax=Anaeromyxobacter diazotrophicus TaxID=2590199 RepID=A0A7I9VT10_9BACT|nr:CxxxxCH/CxxCH domain-containing protein [Anaeromyxobacter diazotrophicus]GEJ59077.1 hypothetical protein AMYX_38180 [Anaeromyxobacter diazotrophicus]